MKKPIVVVSLLTLALGIFLGGAELVVRAQGYEPWSPALRSIQVDPGGRLYEPDGRLGYRHLPGRYRVTLTNGYTWTTTHDARGLRRTAARAQAVSRPGLWIFGCSFTHGWSLQDEETYPWGVQAALGEFEVSNFGVGGYGTLQSWLQLEAALGTGEGPAICVLAYADFHDARNTFLRERRKSVVTWNTRVGLPQPHAWLDESGELAWGLDGYVYREFPGQRRSAFVHFLEELHNERERERSGSHEVSKAIIQAMARSCSERGVRFLVAGINGEADTREMLRWCAAQGLDTADLAVPLDAPGHRNLPYNAHPSALANRKYADKLLKALVRLGWLEENS